MGGVESADPVVFSQLLREGRSRVLGYLLALVRCGGAAPGSDAAER